MAVIAKSSGDISSLSTAPAQHGTVVTKHDTNPNVYRSIWVGGVGDINVMFMGDSVATLIVAVPAGTLLPFAVKLILATDTTATLIIGLE
jgi:hypothetical protein